MAYFGGIFIFANMGGGGGQTYFHEEPFPSNSRERIQGRAMSETGWGWVTAPKPEIQLGGTHTHQKLGDLKILPVQY